MRYKIIKDLYSVNEAIRDKEVTFILMETLTLLPASKNLRHCLVLTAISPTSIVIEAYQGVKVMEDFFEGLEGKAVQDKKPATEGRNIIILLTFIRNHSSYVGFLCR